MKNFKLLTLLITTMICTHSIYTNESNQRKAQRSLTAYLYSYLTPQIEESIPAAIDAHKKVIIFDLDGVLCKTNDLQAFYEIGMKVILEYMLKYGKPSTKKIFEALEYAPAVTKFDMYNEGLRMPQIMVDWQTNAQELRDIQDSMVQHILSSNLTITEKNLLVNTILMMTMPEKYIATRQTIPAGIELARNLKKQGYRIYILSNWDPTSFGLFQEKFPEIFMHEGKALFDGIMISGKVGMVKPDPGIFQAFLKKFNIKASHAIFIDDTIENIQGAQNLGLTSIHCKNRDLADVLTQLIKILKQ
ncbi:HAD family phosphatase [Candidatus Babeliales bacterium]|nr:HAD family phosphatase [Candidatus Babeliales bacterium]MBP9843757.1 HAD family phosphatase [Candidatus Babeliales bacterium]